MLQWGLYRQDKVRFCDKYNNKYPRHAQAVAPSAWPKTHPNSFRQLLSLLARADGEGGTEKMRTDCRIRNGSCYNDANDTSSQMLKFSVAPELPAPSTAVTADESFGSGSLPRPPHGPPACLIFQYFAHKRRKLFFIFPPAGSLSMHPKAIPRKLALRFWLISANKS